MKAAFCRSALAAGVLIFLCYGSFASDKGAYYHSFKDQGIEREYYLYVPDGLYTEGAPLVFSLHGYGGLAWDNFPGMMETAAREGFAICYPQGAVDPNGRRAWEVGYPFQAGNRIDDVKFLVRLAHLLQHKYGFSRKATFVTGMSNGGEMCYYLAYRAADTFRAVAPIAGLQMEWMYKSLDAKKAVPLMEVHGTEDTISWWQGDLENKGGWGEYLPVEIAVGNWVSINRCTDLKVEERPRLSEDSHPVVLYRYTGGTEGTEVRLYKVIDGSHSHSNDSMHTSDEVWSFFSRFID